MREVELLGQVPELYHVTSTESWDGVLRRGLLSVERLVELYELDEADATSILSERRSDGRRFEHPEHGVAWIRDQRPLNVAVLAKMLDDMTVTEYLRRLNGLVFFWADRDRLKRLWSTRRYSDAPQIVLALDTASVLDAHAERVLISSINSGATRAPSGLRGTHTFRSVAEFPAQKRVAELAVVGGLPDLGVHLRRAWSRLPRS